jgi:hypothetical protein
LGTRWIAVVAEDNIAPKPSGKRIKRAKGSEAPVKTNCDHTPNITTQDLRATKDQKQNLLSAWNIYLVQGKLILDGANELQLGAQRRKNILSKRNLLQQQKKVLDEISDGLEKFKSNISEHQILVDKSECNSEARVLCTFSVSFKKNELLEFTLQLVVPSSSPDKIELKLADKNNKGNI